MSLTSTVTRSKLNKTQLQEFAASHIGSEYASINFINITKAQAPTLLGATTDKELLRKGSSLFGGWVSHDLSSYKPKSPRTLEGKLVKYETIITKLTKVKHPDSVFNLSDEYTYFVEGHKKAVAWSQHSKALNCYAVQGLSHFIALKDEIAAIPGKKRFIFDNDNTIGAIKLAKQVVKELPEDAEIALFSGFKGIDDYLANGQPAIAVSFVNKSEWSAKFSGYLTGDVFRFKSHQFIEIEVPKKKKLVTILAPKGSGKTWFAENHVSNIKSNRNAFVSTHRIALSRSNAKRLGIPYIDDSDYQGGSCGFVIDSCQKVKLEDCIGATIFLDEIDQQIEHLLTSDTLKYKRASVIAHFKKILQRVVETSGQIIIASADLKQKDIDFICELAGIKSDDYFHIHNTYVFKKGKLLSYSGVRCADGRTRPLDLLQDAIERCMRDERVIFTLSARTYKSKFSTQVLEALLISLGIPDTEILRIDSATISDPKHPAYQATEHINELCEKYRIVIVSPSLGTGVDIQYRGFDFCCSIQNSHTPDSARQATERLRYLGTQRALYAPTEVRKNDLNFTDVEDIHSLNRRFIESIQGKSKDEVERMPEYHILNLESACQQYWLQSNQEKAIEFRNYRNAILQGYRLEGFEIEHVSVTTDEAKLAKYEDLYEQLKNIATALEQKEKLAKQEAQPIDEKQAEALYKATALSADEQFKLSAYQFKQKYDLEPTVALQTALEDGKDKALEHQFAATEGFDESFELWKKEEFFYKKSPNPDITSDFVKRNLRMARVHALKNVDFFEFISNEFNSTQARDTVSELQSEKLNDKLFSFKKDAVKTIQGIAAMFNFKIELVRKTKSERFYKGFDLGLKVQQDSQQTDFKEHIFTHWHTRNKAKIDAWQNYKADYMRIKLAKSLDELEKPQIVLNAEEHKYTALSTRAKTIPMPAFPGFSLVSESNLHEFLNWLENQTELGVDTETYSDSKKGGLDFINGHIRLIPFASDSKVWVLERSLFKKVESDIRKLLQNKKQRKVFHNALFDYRFLKKEFGVLVKNCADTMLGSKCLLGDMGAAKISGHSLKDACWNLLGVALSKDEQNSDWGRDELSFEQIEYTAKDAWYTFQLYKRLETVTKKPSILLLPFPEMMAWDAWEVENNFLFAAQQMEDTGYQIDMQALENIETSYYTVLNELEEKWAFEFKPTQKEKFKSYLRIKYPERNIKSLNKAAASALTDLPEVLLMQQICALKALLLSLTKIKTQIDIFCCVKPVFKALSGTGRTSSGDTKLNQCLINLQSLSARVNPMLKAFDLPKLKSIFKTNLIIDLPASHGRISAELSNDLQHIEGYVDKNIDMHCVTASAISLAVFPEKNYKADWIKANKDTDSDAKGLRDTSKNSYYGWLNGAGVGRIREQISSNLQIVADKNVCQQALNGLQNTFARTTEYGKEKLKELEANQFIVNGVICGWYQFAGTYICWKLGKVGESIKVPATKAFAGIWSRTESLLMKRACSRIAEKFDSMPEWCSRLQNFIHDEINAEIGCKEAAIFAHSVVREEFGKICYRTVVGFDSLEKCYPLNNWGDK